MTVTLSEGTTEVQETGKSVLHELNSTGDTRHEWDPDNPGEVEIARSIFNKLKKKGHLTYRVDRLGQRGEVIREFDPTAAKIIAQPQTVGG